MTGMMKLALITIGTPGGPFPGTSLTEGAYFDAFVVNAPCGTHPETGRSAGREYPISP
jgi:hypothetical protein